MIELLDEELDAMRRIAQSTARRFWGFVEYDDVAQELALWVCDHYPKVIKWREQRGGVNLAPLTRTLTRVALRYARHEQAAWRRSMPRTTTPLEEYTPQALRAALPIALGEEPDAYANLGPTAQAVVIDIHDGLERLEWKDRGVIEAAVQFDFDFESVAQAYSDDTIALTPDAARKRVERALIRLARAMNGPPAERPVSWKGVPRYSNADIIRAQEGSNER